MLSVPAQDTPPAAMQIESPLDLTSALHARDSVSTRTGWATQG